MSNPIKKSDYMDNKRAFCFRADSELRGINATCKVIVSMYDNKDKDLLSVLSHDGMSVDAFRNTEFIQLAKVYLPNFFDSKGAICRLVKVYESNEETKAKFDTFSKEFEFLSGNDGNGVYRFFKVPVYKWTTNQLYNFVKRALKARDKAGKQAESLSKIDTKTLQEELNKRTESKPESKPESAKKASK